MQRFGVAPKRSGWWCGLGRVCHRVGKQPGRTKCGAGASASWPASDGAGAKGLRLQGLSTTTELCALGTEQRAGDAATTAVWRGRQGG